MLKNARFYLLIALILPFTLKAEWVPLDSRKPAGTAPEVTLVSHDHNSTVIRIELSGFELKEFSPGNNIYQAVDLLSESFTTDPGLSRSALYIKNPGNS